MAEAAPTRRRRSTIVPGRTLPPDSDDDEEVVEEEDDDVEIILVRNEVSIREQKREKAQADTKVLDLSSFEEKTPEPLYDYNAFLHNANDDETKAYKTSLKEANVTLLAAASGPKAGRQRQDLIVAAVQAAAGDLTLSVSPLVFQESSPWLGITFPAASENERKELTARILDTKYVVNARRHAIVVFQKFRMQPPATRYLFATTVPDKYWNAFHAELEKASAWTYDKVVRGTRSRHELKIDSITVFNLAGSLRVQT